MDSSSSSDDDDIVVDDVPIAIALPALEIPEPELRPAKTKVPIHVVDDDNVLREEQAYLIEDSANPSQCYQKWKGKKPIILDGKVVVFCQVLQRDKSSPSSAVVFKRSNFTVAIKKIKRHGIDAALQKQQTSEGPTLNENPYNEIRIMQNYGNYQNIMPCFEALEDPHFLYIVMLNVREGDLWSHLQLNIGYLPREEIPSIIRKLVSNLQYIQQHNLIHRDLKPENCVMRPPWIPFIDFAMTVKSGMIEHQVQDVLNRGRCGTKSYWSPEIFWEGQFNYKADVWAIGCILWRLLTGMPFYEYPTDKSFLFFIQAGGMNDEERCNIVLDELLHKNDTSGLVPMIQAVQVLTPVVRDLLSKLLQMDPANRPNLEEILLHPYFHQ